MSAVARRIRATPERSSIDAWQFIVDLIAPCSGQSRDELLAVSGIAASIIATESPRDAAIIIKGKGPRVRIYCLYDEDSVTGDQANEAALVTCPTEAEWHLSLPVEKDELEWISDSLAKKSSRIKARVKTEDLKEESDEKKSSSKGDPIVNLEAFFKP